MSKPLIVAVHEFLVTIKRVWFVISTFVFPLIFLGIGGVMMLIMKQTVEDSQARIVDRPLGVIDQWGGMKSDPPFPAERFSTEAEALEAIRARKISTFIIVPADYLDTGRIVVKTSLKPTLLTAGQALTPPGLDDWMINNVLADAEERRRERAKKPFDAGRTVYLDAEGAPSTEDAESTVKRSITAYGFFFVLFMSIFTASGYLLNGMADEKENRVMEIVLSAVTPDQLMLGKLLGLGAAGLLQLAIWICMGVAGVLFFAIQIVLDPVVFVYCLTFFLLGYLLYGSLMLGFGALGTNFRESQQMASLWTFIGISPIFVHMALVEAPHGTLARVFSYVPLTAPVTMMLRYVTDPKGMPWYEIPAVIAILLLSTFLALRMSAKLYRVGLLLYGKRPSIREIWRWVRSPIQ